MQDQEVTRYIPYSNQDILPDLQVLRQKAPRRTATTATQTHSHTATQTDSHTETTATQTHSHTTTTATTAIQTHSRTAATATQTHSRTATTATTATQTHSRTATTVTQTQQPDFLMFWESALVGYQECVVPKSSQEWEKVTASFMETSGVLKDKVSISEVRRVQNPDSYALYSTLKRNVANKLGKQEHEVETTPLWHGTAEENISKIARSKFDHRLSGTVGLYGAGCYFSTTTAYSNFFSIRNDAGEKHMFLVRVVTGEYCKGAKPMLCAPYKPGPQDGQYDSVVDDVGNPTKYIVFHDAAAYPEYIIKYKTAD